MWIETAASFIQILYPSEHMRILAFAALEDWIYVKIPQYKNAL
jgi:hypothetical protein